MANQEPQSLEPRTKNQIYSYRNLLLWQKAQQLALAVIRIAAKLPQDAAAQIIARQIIRSASSVSANIAEGHGRFSLPAHRNHLSIAKASACETDSWLDLLHRAGFIDREINQALQDACDEIIRMLTAKILQLERLEDSGRRGTRIREEAAPYSAEDYLPDQVLGSGF